LAGGVVDPLPSEARAYQGQRAGVVTRTVAAAVDGLVVVGLALVGYLVWAVLRFMVDPLHFTFPQLSWAVGLAATLAVLVGYLTATWSISGRTYGDLLMGLRVLGPWGGMLRPPGALLRALACVLLPIGLLWCAVNPRNRSLQDVLLRTSVIYDWRPRAARNGRGAS
jgi:uncharacterized RDD family membrane protein YckC